MATSKKDKLLIKSGIVQPDEAFKIESNKIYSKYNCHIIIDENDYDEKSFIETSTKLQLPGILEFMIDDFDNALCRIVINYPIDLNKSTNIDRNGHVYTIYYEPNELVISKEYHSDDTELSMITKLVQGHIKFINDPKVLLNIMIDTIKGVDIGYLELMVSNMFRVAGNETELCRLKGDYSDSIIAGVSQQPFIDSWKSALAFQHIDKAVQSGLVQGQPLKNNPIESVLNEDFKNI